MNNAKTTLSDTQIQIAIFAGVGLPCLIGALWFPLPPSQEYARFTGPQIVALLGALGLLTLVSNVAESHASPEDCRLLSAFAGLLQGLEAALFALGLRVWFAWYAIPNDQAMEPLFVGVGAATATIELLRRSTMRKLRSQSTRNP